MSSISTVSAHKIAQCMIHFFHPRTVVEIGCREGIMLREFQKLGVAIFGVDQEKYESSPFWIENRRAFQIAEIEKVRIQCKKQFDLAISMHSLQSINTKRISEFIHDLTLLSNIVMFYAPFICYNKNNEIKIRLQSYYIDLFKKERFIVLDCIRPDIWMDSDIEEQYRQNLLVFVKETSLCMYPKAMNFYFTHRNQEIYDIVHPLAWKNCIEKIDNLSVTLREKKSKYVLYAFYTITAFGFILTHRMTKHSADKACLLIARRVVNILRGTEYEDSLKDFVKKGIFQGVYTYNEYFGRKTSNLKDAEREILCGINQEFLDQNLTISAYDHIYVGAEIEDTIGTYFAMKGIPFSMFDYIPDLFRVRTEAEIKKVFSNEPGYRDILLKYGTLVGKYEKETLVVYPDSKTNFQEERVEYFDPKYATTMLSWKEKVHLRKCFGIDESPKDDVLTWVCAPSPTPLATVLNQQAKFLQKFFSTWRDLYFYAVQVLLDYYVPFGSVPLIKCHPNVPIDKGLSNKFLNGAYAFHPFFLMGLNHIVPRSYIPKHVILMGDVSTASELFDFDSHKITCGGIGLFPVFFQKYFVVLHLLDSLNFLYKNVGERFDSIGKHGDYCGYNTKFLSNDINTLVDIHFPGSQNKCEKFFCVLQDDLSCIFENLEQKASSNDFIIYTDVWETLSISQLLDISKKFYVGIVKISKKPVKPVEDILVPLQDEYIFFVSKDDSYRTRLASFNAFKENKAMGIELSARMVSIEEYTG